MRRFRTRLSYANVLATLALFFSLSGGAMAVGKYIVATDPITSGDLTGSTYGAPVIGAGKVTSVKIANGAITTGKFDPVAMAPDADKLDGHESTDFLAASGVPGKIAKRTSTLQIGAQTSGGTGVNCLQGEVLVGGGATFSTAGGGFSLDFDDYVILSGEHSFTPTTQGWTAAMHNGADFERPMIVTAYCAMP